MSAATGTRCSTRTRIVEVAARLLRDEGPTAVTTRAVAQQAGVQPPAIYRLFGDKDGLLEAVAEHVMTTHVSSKAAAVEAAIEADVDPLDDLRAGWRAQIEFGVANPAVFHFLSDPSRVLRSRAAQAGRRILQARVHRVAAAGRLRVSEARAVSLLEAGGTGTIQTLLATPPEQRDLGLADAVYDAVLAQILTDTPESRETGALASAIALRAIAPELDALTESERRLLADWLDRVIDAADRSPQGHAGP